MGLVCWCRTSTMMLIRIFMLPTIASPVTSSGTTRTGHLRKEAWPPELRPAPMDVTNGMGVTAGDYNCDGWLDIFKTNFSDDMPNLYRNLGKGFFEDDVTSAGLGIHTRYLGWGCGFFDPDNDGWLDIFYVNGHVYPEVDRLNVGITYREPMVFYRNLGNGKFRDVSSLAGSAFSEKIAGR